MLIAEDHDMNWEIAEALLSNYGFLLERAENGQICVNKFNAASVGYYDIILMDLRMPVMDGFEATKHIRALPRRMQIFLLLHLRRTHFPRIYKSVWNAE